MRNIRKCFRGVVIAAVLVVLGGVMFAASGCAGSSGPGTTLQLSAVGEGELSAADIDATAAVIKKRLELQPKVRGANVQKEDGGRFLVKFNGTVEAEMLKRILTQTGHVTFVGPLEYPIEEGDEVPESTPVALDGTGLESVEMDEDQYQRPAIFFKFNEESAEKFGKVTSENVGKYLPIALDGKVLSCPTIQGAIFGGSGQITGDFTEQETALITSLMSSGELKAKVEIVEE